MVGGVALRTWIRQVGDRSYSAAVPGRLRTSLFKPQPMLSSMAMKWSVRVNAEYPPAINPGLIHAVRSPNPSLLRTYA